MGLEVIYKNIQSLDKIEKNFEKHLEEYYSESENCILYVKPVIKDSNIDFLLISPSEGVFIFTIVPWKSEDILYFNNLVGELKTGGVKNPFFSAKQTFNFIKTSFENSSQLINVNGELELNLKIVTLFSHMDKQEIERVQNSFPNSSHYSVSSKEIGKLKLSLLKNEDEVTFILDVEKIKAIRSTLFPEIRVAQENKKEVIPSFQVVEEMIKVLDCEQEKIAHSTSEGIQIIRGVPGSGKTVILIARAVYLAKIFPTAQIKILTYTRTLKSIIKNKLKSLSLPLEYEGVFLDNISVDTFHSLALEISNCKNQREYGCSEDFFFKNTLPKLALEKAKETYDYLLIDEYQDFHRDWIEVCFKISKSGKNGEKNILFAGDPMQSIYDSPKYNLNSLESVEKEQVLLKSSYRTGKRQMEIALSFLDKDPSFEQDIKDSYIDLKNIKTQNIHNSGINFIENGYKEVKELLNLLIFEKSYNPSDILILAPRKIICDGFYQYLSEELQEKFIFSKNIQENHCVLTTYHSAKGIESKVCILLNFEQIENKKLAYVAITRASEQVYIHTENLMSQNFSSTLYNLNKNLEIV